MNKTLLCCMCVCAIAEAKALKDEATLESLALEDGGVLYFKDLGAYCRFDIVGTIIIMLSLLFYRTSDWLVNSKSKYPTFHKY